jgi:hypothetical protein
MQADQTDGLTPAPCNRTASWYSASISSPESSSSVSRYRYAGLRHHAHVDQAGQVAPAATQVPEGAGGAGLIDLQPALARRRNLADRCNKALLGDVFR